MGPISHCEKKTWAFKEIKCFLKLHDGRKGSFFWPGNSPDMNPIEHAWANLKTDFGKIEPKPKTKIRYKALEKIWRKHINEGLHIKLVKSFKKRIKVLKENHYKNTKY